MILDHAEARGPVAPQVRYVSDWPDPGPPGPGEARLRVLASALNHMDLWTGMGIPGVEIEYPHVGGVDACGMVEAVGEGVDPDWIGRRVVFDAAVEVVRPARPGEPSAATYAPALELIGEHRPGAHREHFCVAVDNLVDVGGADPVEAAAIGLTALTAYAMMFSRGGLRPGQFVLITGIGGGVATAALGLARWAACRIAVTSRHRSKLDRAREHGAEFTVLDEGRDWSKEVRQWTRKRGVDMVVDTVGGPLLEPALRSLARGGAYVTAGATAGAADRLELHRIFWNQLRLVGSTMGSPHDFREVMALFCAGLLRPIIDSVFPPERAREAWERLERGQQMGKIVLDWRSPRPAGAPTSIDDR